MNFDTLKKYIYIILGGDININTLNDDSGLKSFKHILKTYGMFRIVDFPTTISKTSKSAI